MNMPALLHLITVHLRVLTIYSS